MVISKLIPNPAVDRQTKIEDKIFETLLDEDPSQSKVELVEALGVTQQEETWTFYRKKKKLQRYAPSIVVIDITTSSNTKVEYSWFEGHALYLGGLKVCSVI